MGKRGRGGNGGANSNCTVEELIENEECLNVCVMGNLRGVKKARLIRDFEACAGYAGFQKMKKAVSLNWAHLEFADQDQKAKTLRAIEHLVFKNKAIAFTVKRDNTPTESKRPRLNAEDIDVRDVVTPLWKMSYEEQLAHKGRFINRTLFHITKRTLEDSKHAIPHWIQQIPKMRGPCCEYDRKVVPSPVQFNYRNKVSFTAGVNPEGQVTLGFSLGAVKDDIDCVGNPSECSHISPRALEIRKILEKYLQASDLKPWNKDAHDGFWRRCTVRTFSTGEGLVIIQANPEATGLTAERLAQEKESLVKLFEENKIGESLCFLPWSGISNFAAEDVPVECLAGQPYAHEVLFDLKFRVSPTAFFQVNTKGAEVLYEIIRDWCNVSEKSTVIDICCGTGSITLCLAKYIKNIVGVEMNASAIQDAELNAKLNGITNAEFLVGKAEDVVPGMLQKFADCEEFVAVVDPPRAGLHKSVIRAIRECAFIKKVVFISCDHTNGLLQNAAVLCRATSKSSPGMPFKPVKVTAVDMFPHTDCVEVVMLFERETTAPLLVETEEVKTEEAEVPADETKAE